MMVVLQIRNLEKHGIRSLDYEIFTIKKRTDYNWEFFKKQRNLCTALKRKAKKDFFMRKTKDQVSFWKIFGPYLSNKGHHSQEDYIIINDGELVNNKKDVANLFNDYYINIIENTTGKKLDTFKPISSNVIEQIIEQYKNHHSVLLIKERLKQNPNFDTFEIPPCKEPDI